MNSVHLTLYNSFDIYSSTNATKTLYEKDIMTTYKEIFDKALQEYNKNIRNDRKILDYYKHICNSKQQNPFYELVIQFGNKNTNTYSLARIGEKILTEYADIFLQKYKLSANFYIIGMYLSFFDNVPRLYIKYIPVAHNYKKGLNTRISKNKALIEMGFYHYSNEERKVIGDFVLYRMNIANEIEQLAYKYNITLKKPYSNMLTNHMLNTFE